LRAVTLDASVAVKWVIDDPYSEQALLLLSEGVKLHAPGHWLAEVANTLWARSRFNPVITMDQAAERLGWLSSLAVHQRDVGGLSQGALRIASALDITVYYSLYLEASRETGAPLITADGKLFERAQAARETVGLTVWIGDLTANWLTS
jgi:predicted nucleic acid-binding protein